jgi:large subunit ribosomal protein L11
MSSKKAQNAVASAVKLFIGAGQASPSPPVGPALGQRGVKAIDFCKQFNDRTKDIIPGTPVRVDIKVNPDRTFSFSVKSPATSYFLKKAAGIEKGAGQPGKEDPVGSITMKHIYEIAKIKQKDPGLTDVKLEKICKSIVSTARSMGLTVSA